MNPTAVPDEAARTLADRFACFALEECHDSSPLYERLALGVADDPAMLALAAYARPGQPTPNLLFAAVQYLLLGGTPHPLAAFYPGLAHDPVAGGDPYPAFHDFCRQHADSIRELLETRLVQTNEVRRSACLLPAFCWVARLAGDRPLALLEIGASAGLNLLWDR